MLVNGTAYPRATVQARRYRLRILNACNARFLNLQLYVGRQQPKGSPWIHSGVPTNAPFVNAATERRLRPACKSEPRGASCPKPARSPSKNRSDTNPTPSNTGVLNPSLMNKSLIVAPAERPDVIVDFSNYAGKSVILYNDAPAPFPEGDDLDDYFPGWNRFCLSGVTEQPDQQVTPGHSSPTPGSSCGSTWLLQRVPTQR